MVKLKYVWLGYTLVPKNDLHLSVFASLEAAKREMPKLLAKRVFVALGLSTPEGLNWSGSRPADNILTLWWAHAHNRDFIRIERAEVLS